MRSLPPFPPSPQSPPSQSPTESTTTATAAAAVPTVSDLRTTPNESWTATPAATPVESDPPPAHFDENQKEAWRLGPVAVPNKTDAACWEHIVLLPRADIRQLVKTKKNDRYSTHYCKHCSIAMFCSWNPRKKGVRGSYTSTTASNHLKNAIVCPKGFRAAGADLSKISKKIKKGKHDEVVQILEQQKTMDQEKRGRKFGMKDKIDVALCKQAHWFIYGKSCPPMSTFRKNEFKDVLQALVNISAFNNFIKAPVLTLPMLKRYIFAEYKIFRKRAKDLILKARSKGSGNPFAQYIQDTTTFDNKVKYLAVGLQVVDPEWLENHVIAIAFKEILSSTGQACKEVIGNVCKDLVGKTAVEIFGSGVQDRAALMVASELI